jgi:hypothetical protein
MLKSKPDAMSMWVNGYWGLAQSRGEKLHLNLATTHYYMNNENTWTERLRVIKAPNQWLGFRCTNPNTEIQEIWKIKATSLPQNSATLLEWTLMKVKWMKS